ncbi:MULTISPECIES: D-alanyl-D-alanine carboxypeptidase/D-alanyl-D-alanine endopeptidase [unclassified Carboxylicivirga]|uniref:D-alanyl-D-alanine carboxypeptidase/D-alanyl-D-alanine endopeptidase n=1 Tax=Carboxylicivirga TaxID=1628153 RepID=UPI003D347B6B
MSVAPTSITQQGAISLYAVDINTGDIVLSHHPRQRMTPASLTKIMTTGAALHILGDDYRYQTRFYLRRDVAGYSLYVLGGGDPTLGSSRFEGSKSKVLFRELLSALQKAGVKSLNKLVIDNTCYTGMQQPSKRLWEDMGNYYGAAPDGLTYRENTFHLELQSPPQSGAPVRIVSVNPAVGVGFDCMVLSADNKKDSAYIYGHPLMDTWQVSGTIPRNRTSFTIKGAMPHPGQVLARELKAYLSNSGITVGTIEKGKGMHADHHQWLYTHYSPPLSSLIAVVNKKSHNLFADHLLFSLAQTQGAAHWDKGVAALEQFWRDRIPDFSGTFYDGSGLSPFNALAAVDMVAVLQWLYQYDIKGVYKESLAVAGVDGTLRSILKDEAYQARVIGKSGSMNGVLAYCGYLTTNRGKTLAFCIMANHFTESYSEIRSNMEALMKQIIVQN